VGLELRLLGPVQAWIGDRRVDLGVRQQRFVLAVLALEANRVVPTDRLVDLIWGDDPPAKARTAVYAHVSRLRAVGVVVRRDDAGYVLECDPALIDAHRFGKLVARATECADDEARLALLDRALGLWRGPALAGAAPEQTRLRLARQLEQARLAAAEARFDALLRLGRHREAVDELGRLAAEHPGQHRFTAQLMLALHRGGRQAEALAVYRDARRWLADELGLDPPPELRRLEQAILVDEPAPPPREPAPAELPADLQSFIGRGDELAQLGAGARSGVWVIDGMAGVGKTALAVHAAHLLSPDFPDGQLFVDLRGHSQGLQPVRPVDALGRMLRGLGVSEQQIPPEVDDRAALLRSRLAGRRVLVVLDNAADEAQVRPLLPASAGCLVLITSRRRLTGLDDARPVSLDVLARGDALDLFRAVSGRSDGNEGVENERDGNERDGNDTDGNGTDGDEQAEIVELCGRLPLAIRIAAARLRARPTWTVAHLAGRLRDERHRLAELDAGQRSVATAFRLSFDQLPARTQQMFRVLGLHPGADFDTYAAAALAGTTVRDAGRDLEELVDVHLLQQRGPGRYAFHDLIRAWAVDRAEREEPDPRVPVGRLLDHYRQTASVAMDRYAPQERHRRPAVAVSPAPTPELTDAAAATAWLDTELANLVAAAEHAAAGGWTQHACDLAATLFRFLDTRGHYLLAFRLHGSARSWAAELGDPATMGHALINLASACQRLARYPQAIEHYGAAVELFHQAGDAEWQARALHNLSGVAQRRGRYAESIAHCHRALEVWRSIGDQDGEAHVLHTLSGTYKIIGRYAEAIEYGQRALDLHTRSGNEASQAHALHGLAVTYQRLGRHAEALDHYRRAAALFRATDNPALALTLAGLGMIHLHLGEHAEALDNCQRAIELSRSTHDRNAELEARYNLGEVLRAMGRHGAALGQLQAALNLAGELDQPHDLARTHDALARLHDDLGEPRLAGEHREHAVAIFTSLGTPDAEQVRQLP
jgi:DNA-binding SARP family transcriptional activator